MARGLYLGAWSGMLNDRGKRDVARAAPQVRPARAEHCRLGAASGCGSMPQGCCRFSHMPPLWRGLRRASPRSRRVPRRASYGCRSAPGRDGATLSSSCSGAGRRFAVSTRQRFGGCCCASSSACAPDHTEGAWRALRLAMGCSSIGVSARGVGRPARGRAAGDSSDSARYREAKGPDLDASRPARKPSRHGASLRGWAGREAHARPSGCRGRGGGCA